MSTDTPRSTVERRYDVTTPHTIGTKVAQPQPALSSSREALLDVAIQGTEEDIKAGKKRRKQRRQEATTDDDDSINKQAGGANTKHATEAAGNSKRQAWPPMDHFEKLLKEAPIEDDVTPFPREDAAMTVFGRSSPPEKHCALNPRKGAPSRGDQRWGDEEM
jgi:hypothetical protein